MEEGGVMNGQPIDMLGMYAASVAVGMVIFILSVVYMIFLKGKWLLPSVAAAMLVAVAFCLFADRVTPVDDEDDSDSDDVIVQVAHHIVQPQ